MPGSKASMPEWPVVQLEKIVSLFEPPRRKPTADEIVRFAGVRWYGDGLFVREERTGAEVKGKCFELQPGKLIYNRLFAWKQSFAVVTDEFFGVVVSNEFPQFTVDPDQATPEYVALYCASPMFADFALSRSTGSAAVSRNRLKEDDFLSLPIPLPPVAVQRTLVNVVCSVDAAIRATEAEADRLRDVLKLRRESLVNSEGYEVRKASEVFDIRLGRQRSPARATGPSMTPYLRSANVGIDELRLNDVMSMDFDERERERYTLEPGDVLVSEGSAGADAVGMPAAWNGEIDGAVCFQNTLLRYRAIEGTTIPAYVRHWCLWAYESGAFRDVAPAGVNIKHIGDRRAKAMPIRLPSMDEQQEIVDQLEPVVAAVSSLRTEVRRLGEVRAALIDAVIDREVEVVAVSDKVAD